MFLDKIKHDIFTDLVMYCVVHYKNQTKYSNLKNLSELNIDRIQLAKEKRMRIGGAYSHEEQCRNDTFISQS